MPPADPPRAGAYFTCGIHAWAAPAAGLEGTRHGPFKRVNYRKETCLRSLFEELKRLARPYEDEEDDGYEEDFAPVSAAKEPARDRDIDRDRRNNKVVNIHTTTQLQVVLVSPTRFENASEIADHLRDKRTVVLNLEQTDKNIARRLIDFLSGVAYANEGTIKKVALSTYIITPYNVEILGDLIDELENNGLYF